MNVKLPTKQRSSRAFGAASASRPQNSSMCRILPQWTGVDQRTGAVVYGQSVGRRLSISLGKHYTVFQAEVHAILACVYENETQDRPEKC